ncbi:hypothetical protein [Pseudoduganella buxea]|uniref:Uncharacterized protein n=1 Tax=Pseudoduganella buxea TaxID=1949069 RepID=A0A6I3T0C2_9BURK|nr:hypothetical protein [Pseudoduganella buxea]MTV53187.1 hypothetical protein [Pseudoduganella buxea]GGC11475.1 hypothetical protein GCM10011572_36130 [Pseudoduganella buxea]
MNISSLTSSTASQLGATSRLSGTSVTSSTRQTREMPPPPPDGGGFASAIVDALTSIGVDGSAASTDEATEALGSFMEDLMGALHGQSTATEPSYGEAPQGGPGQLSTDLQGLISALGSDSTGATDSTGALQGSFKELLTALGSDGGDGSDTKTQLTSFLQALSGKLPAAGNTGNLINTTA